MLFPLHDPDRLGQFLTSKEKLAERGEFRCSGLSFPHSPALHPGCGATTGAVPCLLPVGAVVYGGGRFFEAVGHFQCGFHLRPIDHGDEGRWPCISERAVNRTYYCVQVFDASTRNLRLGTAQEVRTALEAILSDADSGT